MVKINCEGAECDVLDRLLEAGELAKVDELLVHFDVRKVPSLRGREAPTRARLDAAGVPYRPAEAIHFGPDIQEKTRNWLGWYHARGVRRLHHAQIRRVSYAVHRALARAKGRLRGS